MILATTFAYNERKYIEEWVKYYRENGCELFVIDNMSNDGTYEYLIKNNIPCIRFDSQQSFDLKMLQKVLTKEIHRIKPEWVVYAGIDLFQIFDKPINEALREAKGNQILMDCWGMLHTGEPDKTPLHKNFYYGAFWKSIIMCSKYDESFQLNGDNIIIDNPYIEKVNGVMINYGACKPIAEQEEKLARRQKAWENGLNKNTGRHFLKGKQRNWRYNRDEFTDIRKTEYNKYLL